MKLIVMDTESDGLTDEATKLHVMSWTEDGVHYHSTNSYDVMRKILGDASCVVCHNLLRHDSVLFCDILGVDITDKCIDTLALSWFLNLDRQKHGLEGFGEDFGVPKPEVDDWSDQPSNPKCWSQ